MSASNQQRSPCVVEGVSALLVQQPFFASLVLDLMEIVESKQLPDGSQLNTCATNGKTLWINPEKFGKLTVQERVGMLAHEVMHVILQHAARKHNYLQLGVGPDLKTFSTKRFDHACDYIINAHLIGQGFKLPLGSLQNSQVTGDDIVDEVYLKLPDDEEDKPDGPDDHVANDGQCQTSQPVMAASLKKAQELAKMQGKGAGGLERLIEQICEPEVPWQEHLRRTFLAMTRGRDEMTWARPNRRKLAAPPHLYLPGRTGREGPEIGIIVDTSGSIGQDELSTFMGELKGIMADTEPRAVHLAYVDDEVHGEVITFDDVNEVEAVAKRAGGGGGTNLPKGFEKFRELELPIESRVVFTDGYTPFGEDDGIPTVWCITSRGVEAPWGTTVHVDIKVAETDDELDEAA